MKKENWITLSDPSAERSVLGACLLDHAIPESMRGILTPRDFYHPKNGEIFASMERLADAKTLIDLTSLTDGLRREDKLERVGGVLYLVSLLEAVAGAANVAYHAKIVLDFSLRRQLQSAARDIISATGDLMKGEAELRDFAENKISSLKTHREKLLRLKDCVEDAFVRLDEPRSYIFTGFADVDTITGGFAPADYVLIAARPSMGKTAWALDLAVNMAENGNAVHVVSLEMSKEMISERMMVSDSGVHFGRYRKAGLSQEEISRLLVSTQKLARLPIFICDNAGLDIYDLKHIVRKSVWSNPKNVVIVDHLQLIQCEQRENRQQEITFISSHLKALAKETNAVLIVLSQLSRAVEGRAMHRPQLSDLRESGSLEQDADEVIFIYRPEYYGITESKSKTGLTDFQGKAEIIVAKHRNGKTGDCWLMFEKERARFLELSYR